VTFEKSRPMLAVILAAVVLGGFSAVLADPKETSLISKPGLISAARLVTDTPDEPLIQPAVPVDSAAWPVARGPASYPLSAQFDPKMLAEAPPEFFEDYSACTLYRGSTYLVASDGTVEAIHHFLYRLNNRAAVEQDGEWPLEFDPTFERLTLNVARVHAADGATRELRPEDVQVRDNNTDYQVYDQFKQAVLSFPGLKVGDVIELAFTTVGRDPSQEGTFTLRYPFNTPVETPLVRGELRLQMPADRPLAQATFGDGVRVDESANNGSRTHLWTVGPIAPPGDEFDPTLSEQYEVGVACSTFASWDEVAAFRRRQAAVCAQCDPQIKEQVARLIAGCETAEEKARAVCAWVRDSIRYRSHRIGQYATVPHAPDDVFRACFGDCWDKSQLLHVMLREAQIDSQFVFVNTEGQGQIDHRVPSPSADHVFLSVRAGAGEHWVDTTATWNPWDQLRRDCYGRQAYFINDRDFRLGALPEMPAAAFRVENDSRVEIQTDGAARWRVSRTWHGLAAGEMREAWSANTAAERRREVMADFRSYYPDADLADFAFDKAQLAAPDEPMAVAFELAVPALFSGEGRRFGTIFEPQLWAYLLSVQSDERRTPLLFPTAFDLRHTVELVAPAGEEFEYVPEPRQIGSKWGSVGLEASIGDDRRHAMLTWRVRLDDPCLAPQDMGEYEQFHEAAYALSGIYVGLRPAAAPSEPSAPDNAANP
jgi:transglutaminase-like putative cysteine protease